MMLRLPLFTGSPLVALLSIAAIPTFAFLPTYHHLQHNDWSLRAGISSAAFGVSQLENTRFAVNEALTNAGYSGTFHEDKPSIAFVSCTASRDVDLVRRVFTERLPAGTPIHGMTSSGAVLTTEGAKKNAIGCLLVSSDDKQAFVTSFDAEGNGAKATKALKRQCSSSDQLQAIFMTTTPGAEEGVLEDLEKEFPGVPVFGGTAADDDLTGAWSVFSAGAASSTGVSLVGIKSGSMKFGASMVGPYTATDKKAKVTKTDGKRRVLEIDGKPAADWVYEWLGDDIKEQYTNGGMILPQTAQKPIGIPQRKRGNFIKRFFSRKRKEDPEYVTCHVAALGGPNDKYVDFFAPIPKKSVLTVMDSGNGPSTGYSSALSQAFDVAKANFNGDDNKSGSKPVGGLLVFCGGMAVAVGDNLDKGLTSAAFTSKADGLPMMGMTCFGEQAYLPKSQKNVQRNLSVGCILFG